MKRLLSNEYNILAARVFLGAVLVLACVDKIADPGAFTKSILDYRLVSGLAAAIPAAVIPWIELLCGMAIMFGLLLRGSSLLAGTLLGIFTLAVLTALIRGLDISCGCFTQDPSAARLGWLKVGENLVLISVSVFVYFSKNMRFSLEQYLRSRVGDP
ncbi:MAG: DoxX family membrane protein [Ignavibacteriales bacterium]|nr:DoxX family membrane protein [Ignavibacteriales bacterium]